METKVLFLIGIILKYLSYIFPLHLDIYVMGLGSIKVLYHIVEHFPYSEGCTVGPHFNGSVAIKFDGEGI